MAMQSQDPLLGFHFKLDLQGKTSGFFTECSGIGSEHEVIEHKVVTADGRQIIMKIPGRLKWENVTLKKGITDDMKIWTWRAEVENGKVESARCNGALYMLDHDLNPVAEWTFDRAWPVKVTGPQPKADGNEIGVEELVIAHEGIRRIS